MLQLYVDGALLYEGDSAILEGWQQFDWANRRMLIGPTAQVDAEASTALYLLDEFALSNVSRTPTELRRDALLPSKQPVYAQSSGNTLPLGLDPQALRIPADKLPGEEKVALGKALFSDSRLSSNGLSCSSCHSPELAYTDAEALAIGHEGQQLQRSTPMAVNRAFGLSQSWDGQSTSLEDQVLRPFEDPMELATNLSDVLVFLNTDPDYSTRFKLTYKQAANRLNLADALASFQRALMSANSRVDRFEHGMDVLTDAEQRGRLLFAGKGRCTACHNGSNYSDELFHPSILTDSADLGRYAVSHRSNDHNAFKTPSLRNVELTAPYFHNGSVASLEEVVALYNEGGGASISQDIEIRPLGLNDAEKADLVAFLKALTGKIVEVRLLP